MNKWPLYCMLLALWGAVATGAVVSLWAHAYQHATVIAAAGIWFGVAGGFLATLVGINAFVEKYVSG